jgi:hypothetical protein
MGEAKAALWVVNFTEVIACQQAIDLLNGIHHIHFGYFRGHSFTVLSCWLHTVVSALFVYQVAST